MRRSAGTAVADSLETNPGTAGSLRKAGQAHLMERAEEQAVGEPVAPVASDGAPELEAVMHLMFDRIEALDAEKRSLKRMTAFGFATLLVLGLLGGLFVARAARVQIAPHDVLLTDGAGRVRARLGIDPRSAATTLQLLDESGRAEAVLGAGGA